MEYKSENRTCQNCKNDFIIESEDFKFYEKIKVCIPNLCIKCRSQLRHIFRNERIFYKRKCDLCEENIISIWSPNKETPVYCVKCWWSDKWDAYSYGIDYDIKKPFFKQIGELYKKVPKPALVGINNIDCQYVNYVADCRNCYMITESSNNENCIYSYWIQKTKDSVDLSFTHQVELSYEVNDCYNSYGLKYCNSCYNCTNSYFLLNCRGCTDCIGCINLRNKSYYIFNQQYSREEYLEKLKEFKFNSFLGVENFRSRFNKFIEKFPRKYAEIYMSINSTGNYQNNVKNNRSCFHSYDAEDNAYSVHVWRDAKDCMDCHTAGRSAEKIYNSTNTGLQASNCFCCHNCWGSNFTEYSFNCPSGMNLFGCMALKNGQYSILNKKYSKEEYEKIRFSIIESLKKNNKYGEYFSKEIMLFGYNETTAMEEFPLTKEEALSLGYKWEDKKRGIYGEETIEWNQVPENIEDVSLNIKENIFKCLSCSKNYRIIENEFNFYKKINVPIPRFCPDCRHNKRLENRGKNILWHRKCMKEGCTNEFETFYAPDRPEIVYCESCYNKEIY